MLGFDAISALPLADDMFGDEEEEGVVPISARIGTVRLLLSPGRIWPETTVYATAIYEDAEGVAIDPSTVAFSLMSPSGGSTTYLYSMISTTVTKIAVGRYMAEVVPGEAGRWRYRWVATGSGNVSEGNFVVQDSVFVDSPAWDYTGWGG